MNLALAVVLLIAAQRLVEVIHGERNARRLLAEGPSRPAPARTAAVL